MRTLNVVSLRAKDDGRLRLHRRFPSRYLSTPRDIVVYLPPGYDEPARRYPVLYLQDGQNLFDPATAFGGQDWHADVTADDADRRGAIEPLILVGIYNTGRAPHVRVHADARSADPKGGKATRYAQMMAREIKPFIDHEYRTRKGAVDAGVGGSSLGALVSLMAGLQLSAGIREAGAAFAVGVVGRAFDFAAGGELDAAGAAADLAGRGDGGGEPAGEGGERCAVDARCAAGEGMRKVATCTMRRSQARGMTSGLGGRFGRVLEYLFRENDAESAETRRKRGRAALACVGQEAYTTTADGGGGRRSSRPLRGGRDRSGRPRWRGRVPRRTIEHFDAFFGRRGLRCAVRFSRRSPRCGCPGGRCRGPSDRALRHRRLRSRSLRAVRGARLRRAFRRDRRGRWAAPACTLHRRTILAHDDHALLGGERNDGRVVGETQRVVRLFAFAHGLGGDLKPRRGERDLGLERLHRRLSSTHGFARRNSSVRMMPCSMVSSGFQPSERMRAQSRKMNGLSPTQPRSPPA